MVVGPALLVLNAENFCSTWCEAQCGHTGGLALWLSTILSKLFLQLRQAYSKMGMARDYSLALPPQPSSCFFPDRGEEGGAQVKRDNPGMRGKTKKYTTKNRITISKLSIRSLYVAASRFTNEKAEPRGGGSGDGLFHQSVTASATVIPRP